MQRAWEEVAVGVYMGDVCVCVCAHTRYGIVSSPALRPGIGAGSLPTADRGAGGCGFAMSPGSRAVRNYSSAESEVPCWYLWFTSALT